MAITDKKVSEAYAGRDISSLGDRPNQDGLTAAQLKARFDQLGKEVIPKYNNLIDELNADLYNGLNNTGHTHNIDNLIDGLTYKLYTAIEKAKLSGIQSGAEVNQNAFSNVKVGSTTIASSVKTDTLELVAGLNVSIAVDALTKKITLSATGDLATKAVQSYIEDIGNYFTSLNVEGALQEVGAKLSPSNSKVTPIDADTILLSDSADSNIFKKLTWANIKATLFDLQGGQIKFPATQVPSADANTLDDYEKGTFTPTVSFATTTGTITYTVRQGRYIKVGSLVTIFYKILFSQTGSSGFIKLGGFPFVVLGDPSASGATFVNTLTSVTGTPIARADSGQTFAYLYQIVNGSNSPLGDTNTVSADIEFTMSYIAN